MGIIIEHKKQLSNIHKNIVIYLFLLNIHIFWTNSLFVLLQDMKEIYVGQCTYKHACSRYCQNIYDGINMRTVTAINYA